VPISTIACFEAFFRSTIKEIVDFGKPFSGNVSKLNQANNAKLDFETVAAIQTKTLTVGEFVAHILPCNKYSDIESNLSILCGINFSKELKAFNKVSIFDDVNLLTKDFQERYDEIMKSVNRTFELRHIFCHEFATNFPVDIHEITANFRNCKLFLEQTNNLIWELLYPNSPETQLEMNEQAHESLEGQDKILQNLVALIKKEVKNDIFEQVQFNEELFDKCMDQWQSYRNLHGEYVSERYTGGSMQPLIYLSDMEKITKEKIESLQNEFEFLLRKIGYV
jgi:hypothetical protein